MVTKEGDKNNKNQILYTFEIQTSMHFPYQINATSTKRIEERNFEKELITNIF